MPLSLGMGFPQCGQVPEVMPIEAATGMPQLGQVPSWTWFPGLAAIALGLKHMLVPFSRLEHSSDDVLLIYTYNARFRLDVLQNVCQGSGVKPPDP